MSWKLKFPQENIYYETEKGILYCGDCLEILPKLPKHSVDLVITDPPYGVGSGDFKGIDYKDEFYDVPIVALHLYNVLKDDSRLYLFTAQKTFIEVVEAFVGVGFKFHQALVWHRPNLVGGTKKKTYDFTSVYEHILNLHKGRPPKLKKLEGLNNTDVLKYAAPQSNYKQDKRYHVHQKPLKLIEHLVLASSSKGDIILDPFLGSGTTAVVCEKLDRRWIGIELNPKYCEITKKRLEEVVRHG